MTANVLGQQMPIEAHENLLQNPVYAAGPDGAPRAWETAGDWRKGSIESFNGLPFTLDFLAAAGGSGRLSQANIAVKTQTWYVMECWYQAEFTRGGFAALYAGPAGAAPGAARRYCQTSPYHGDMIDPEDPALPPAGGIRLGNAADWMVVRAYAFSGGRERLDWVAEFKNARNCAFGYAVLRELTGADYGTAGILDGSFEKAGAGASEPVSFTKHSLDAGARLQVSTDGRGGRSSLSPNYLTIIPGPCPRRPAPAGESNGFAYVIGPQSLLALPGQRVRISFWARKNWSKDDTDNTMLHLFTLRQGAWWRTGQGWLLQKNWEEYIADIEIPDAGPRMVAGPQLLDIHLQVTTKDRGRTAMIGDFKVEFLSGADAGAAESRAWWWTPQDKNLAMNGSFEAGFKGWQPVFSTWAPLAMDRVLGTAAIDTNTAADGQCSLRLDIPAFPEDAGPTACASASASRGRNLSETAVFAWVSGACFPVEINQKYTLSFYARTDHPRVMRIHDEGSSIEPAAAWQRFSWGVTATPQNAGAGLYHPTINIQGSGTLWLDGVMVERGAAATEFKPAEAVDIGGRWTRRHPYYSKSETPAAVIQMCSVRARPARLVETLRDWRGGVVRRYEKAVNLPANGVVFETRAFPHDAFGVFEARLELQDPQTGAVLNWHALNYAVLPEPDAGLDADQCFFGLIPFPRDFWNGWCVPGGSVGELQAYMRAIGCRWLGEYGPADWRELERGAGNWNGWTYDAYLENARRLGFSIYTIIGGKLHRAFVPAWAASDQPVLHADGRPAEHRGQRGFHPRRAAWEEYVARVAAHYRGLIKYYDFMGETGGATPADFIRYGHWARAALRQADPAAVFMGPNYPSHVLPAGPEDDTWVGKVFKTGAYDMFDIITGHFYAPGERGAKSLEDTMAPPHGTAVDALSAKVRYLREAYGDKPLWDTECGLFNVSRYPWFYARQIRAKVRGFYHADLYGSDRRHAERFVRWNLLKMETGIQRSFNHTFHHSSLDTQSYQALLHPDYSPRIVVGAFAQASRRLLAPKLTGQYTRAAFRASLFDCAGVPVVVCWDYSLDDREKTIVLDGTSPAEFTAEDLMGNPIALTTADGKVTLPIGSAPVYLLPAPGKSGEQLLSAIKNAVMQPSGSNNENE